MNGPQTTGRDYRQLSEPEYDIVHEVDLAVPMRDGTILRVDVHRPDAPGTFPALLAAAPYPRQMQDLGAPAGVIEAGATDFWVSRGYAHVIANLRGTVGSEGTWGFFDDQERSDLYDLVEWVASQSWSDEQVGMIGISYYAMAQLEAAVAAPPHLRAVFPFDVTVRAWDAANHNGLLSSAFITPWLSAIAVLSSHGDELYRGRISDAVRHVLSARPLHQRFATTGGAAAVRGLRAISRFRHPGHPWTDLWLAAAVEHQVRDEWWDERDITDALREVRIPVYLGSEWPNVPLHLGGTLDAWRELSGNAGVRLAVLGEHGLPWPWESMHVEALAWFDQWLKDRDTGILDGPPVRYWLPGAEEWRASETWPPPSTPRSFALGADGRLRESGADIGSRAFVTLAPGRMRSPSDGALPLPDRLNWDSAVLADDLDVVGEIEVRLTASITAADTAWIVLLEDLAPDGSTTPVTQGWLRAGLREVDEAASTVGRPVLPGRSSLPVTPHEPIEYRIPLVPNARRFRAGHRILLTLIGDDKADGFAAMQGFTHTPVGTSSVDSVFASSTLVLPVLD